MTDPGEIIKQHIAWLFQYVRCMNERNWRDMRDNAERQLEQLSAALTAPSLPTPPARDEVREAVIEECIAAIDKFVGTGSVVAFRVRAALAQSPKDASTVSPCSHQSIIGLDGKWHCQRCGAAIEMAVAHTSTHEGGETP